MEWWRCKRVVTQVTGEALHNKSILNFQSFNTKTACVAWRKESNLSVVLRHRRTRCACSPRRHSNTPAGGTQRLRVERLLETLQLCACCSPQDFLCCGLSRKIRCGAHHWLCVADTCCRMRGPKQRKQSFCGDQNLPRGGAPAADSSSLLPASSPPSSLLLLGAGRAASKAARRKRGRDAASFSLACISDRIATHLAASRPGSSSAAASLEVCATTHAHRADVRRLAALFQVRCESDKRAGGCVLFPTAASASPTGHAAAALAHLLGNGGATPNRIVKPSRLLDLGALTSLARSASGDAAAVVTTLEGVVARGRGGEAKAKKRAAGGAGDAGAHGRRAPLPGTKPRVSKAAEATQMEPERKAKKTKKVAATPPEAAVVTAAVAVVVVATAVQVVEPIRWFEDRTGIVN